MSRNGKTQTEVISKLVFENFWIGPSQVCVSVYILSVRIYSLATKNKCEASCKGVLTQPVFIVEKH